MPTQRFLKLKEEKKQAILEAAVHEFSRVPCIHQPDYQGGRHIQREFLYIF